MNLLKAAALFAAVLGSFLVSAQISCYGDITCCPIDDSSVGICWFKDGVCCKGGTACCPNGYECVYKEAGTFCHYDGDV